MSPRPSARRRADGAFSLLLLDLLQEILIRADRPSELGDYLVAEMRELTGARVALVVQHVREAGTTGMRLVAISPSRRSALGATPEVATLTGLLDSSVATQIWRAATPGAGDALRALGFDVSLGVPLRVGSTNPVGALLLLDLPTEREIALVVDACDALATVVALALRASFLIEKQEGIIHERIRAQQKAEHERRQIERQLLHAQRTESLGILAGGIAHDFNNLLAAILGNADLALLDMTPGGPGSDAVTEIRDVARRASQLTNQLLAYSGKGRFVLAQVDMGDLVREMTNLLRTSVTSGAAVHYDLAREPLLVTADAAQLQQLVMNLVINAAESLSSPGGTVTVRTAAARLGRAQLDRMILGDAADEGDFICLEVTDTGMGMDNAAKARIFDPFFTTKSAGRGLGLAAVLGIVRGHGGALDLQSEPGTGTSFRAYLPADTQKTPTREAEEPAAIIAADSTATVLVVDDEASVRRVATRALARLGFDTLEAEDGCEATQIMRRRGETIDAVLLDLTMPRMGGREAARELRAIKDDVPILMMSGYTDSAATLSPEESNIAFVSKPFDINDLGRKLRMLLELEPAPAPAGKDGPPRDEGGSDSTRRST